MTGEIVSGCDPASAVLNEQHDTCVLFESAEETSHVESHKEAKTKRTSSRD